jgi:hypothetical protein
MFKWDNKSNSWRIEGYARITITLCSLFVCFLVRTLLELVKNDTFYHNRFSHIVGSLTEAVKNIVHDYSYSELYEIAGLSNVLKCNIQSVYPKIQYHSDLSIFNSIFQCNQYTSTSNTIFVFWSNTQSEIYARSCNAGNWTPNHFVPLLALPDDMIHQSTFSSSDISLSNAVSRKSFLPSDEQIGASNL